MSVVTLRISDEKHQRLKQLAQNRQMSLNKLFDEMSTMLLVQHDVEMRMLARASQGSAEDGLALLKEFESYDREQGFVGKESYR